MMKKKVIATTILSAAILGSLTGCGGVKTTDDSVVSTGAAEAATEAKEETKATEKAAEGETVVTFWHSLNGSAERRWRLSFLIIMRGRERKRASM